jgi:DNA invertase Pin-like site-specific DNA recombinase
MTTATREDIVRAALYQRVSTTDQSIARQVRENFEAAQANGWTPIEYEDPGLSASRFAGSNGGANRKHWARLLADITAGQLDVLILWVVSRGDRQMAGWATLWDACRLRGVLIYITSKDDTYDPRKWRDRKALLEDGIDAEGESETISSRVQSGKDEGRRAGRPQGGIAYGVHRVRDPNLAKRNFLRDEPDPVTGPVVARIVREAGKGTGYKQIADALNADSILPPSAGRSKRKAARWNGTTVRIIAGNEVYTSTTPPIVTEAEHLAARTRLARKDERASCQTFRYSAVLHCGADLCGHLIRGGNRAKQGGRYTCPQGHVNIGTAEVDTWVDMLAIEALSSPGVIGRFRQPDDSAAAAAWTEAARYRQKIKDATASYNADRIDLATLEEITSVNTPKAEAAEKRARDAETPSAIAGLPDEDRELVRARWESLTIPARKAALRALAPGAIVKPAGRGNVVPVADRVILWPDT